MTYDYSTVSDPVPGIKPGTILPASQFPADLRCPYCPDQPAFRSSSALRGHAHGKHGIRWEVTKKYPEKLDRATMTKPEERETLKPWHMMAIAMHDLFGYTWKEVAKRIGRSESNLQAVAKSPAGRRMREHLSRMVDTPEKVANLLLRATSVGATVDYISAMEWAREARDYDALYRMSKDLLKIAGAEAETKKESSDQQNVAIHIHLDSNSMEEPFVTSDYIEAEVVEDKD